MTIYREGSDSSESWSFKVDDDHRWRWERKAVDGTVLLASPAAFATLEDCQADARTRGYDR
jgi:hypothetical protein